MIVRLVKMTFKTAGIAEFLAFFDSVKEQIADFEGCRKVVLYRDKTNTAVFFTYSEWESVEDLNNYRQSSFFKATWKKTKSLFEEPAEAWSLGSTVEK